MNTNILFIHCRVHSSFSATLIDTFFGDHALKLFPWNRRRFQCSTEGMR
jgi:hypothetical protein